MKRLNKNFIYIGLVVTLGVLWWGVYEYNLEGKNPISKVEYKNYTILETSRKVSTISGKTLALINKGDLIYPKISPDGNLLVYSEVIVEEGQDGYNHEYTQIKLYNIEKQTESILLDINASKQYAYYSAFVTHIDWLNNEQIEIKISDGNTGITTIKSDLPAGCVIKTAFTTNDLLDYELSPEKQQIFDEVSNFFPDFDKDTLRSAIESTGIIIPGRGLILLQKISGENIIWFVNFISKKLEKLASLKEKSLQLEGGFVFNNKIIFLLANQNSLNLYAYHEKNLTQISSLNSSQRNITLEVKKVYPDAEFFLIRMYDSFEKGNNPFFIYDGNRLIQLVDCPDLYDVDISREGQKVVFCYWENGERHLAVKELKRL